MSRTYRTMSPSSLTSTSTSLVDLVRGDGSGACRPRRRHRPRCALDLQIASDPPQSPHPAQAGAASPLGGCRRPGPRWPGLLGAFQPRVAQVEVAQVAHEAEGLDEARVRLRRVLTLPAARRFLGGEVDRLGEVALAVAVLRHGHAEDVRRLLGEHVLLADGQLCQAVHVLGMPLDHLDEAGVVRAAVLVGVHARRIVEDDVGQVLGRPAPPGALLWTVAVAASRLLGREAHHGDEIAVVSGARRGAKPAVRAGLELDQPAVHLLLESARIGRSTLNNLNEHPAPPLANHSEPLRHCNRALALVKSPLVPAGPTRSAAPRARHSPPAWSPRPPEIPGWRAPPPDGGTAARRGRS